jgi:NADH-quinone oxidoreductase subunit L
MHAMGGVIDMRQFGGLRHRLPYTCWTFAIGALALCGLFPLAGFWSKDEILAALSAAGHDEGVRYAGLYLGIYWVATFTALLTAFYTGRAFFMTFWGPEKLPSPEGAHSLAGSSHDAHAASGGPAYGVDTPAPETAELSRYESAMGAHRSVPETSGSGSAAIPHRPSELPEPVAGSTHEPVPQDPHGHGPDAHHGHDSHFGHESPPIMTVPLMVLAVCAVLVGLIFGPTTHWFAHHVEATPTFDLLEHHEHEFDWATAISGTIAALIGLGLSILMYARPSELPGKISAALRPLANASWNKFYVDEAYAMLVVAPTRLLATISRYFDVYVIDGLVKFVAFVPRLVGQDALRPLQNGLVQSYAIVTAMGIAAFLIFLMFVG